MTAFIVLGVVAFAAKRMSQAIAVLSSTVEQLSRGDAVAQVRPWASVEETKLATAINRVSERLRVSSVSRHYTDSVITAIPDAFFAISPQGIIRVVNPAACTLLGYSEADLVGRPVTAILSPTTLRQHSKAHRNAWRSLFDLIPRRSIKSAFFLSKRGDELPVSLSGSVLRDEYGTIAGIVCVAREQRDCLRDADFLVNVNHELRTPMNGVLGMTDLLMTTDLDAEQRRYAQTICHSTKTLLDAINRVFNERSGLCVTDRQAADVAPVAQRRRRVLVADDSQITHKVAGSMLAKLDCEVAFASNGREAVDKWMAADYDLILMDCQMPVMDGLSAAAAIRLHQAGRTRPRIVAITANVLAENRRECLDAGMDDFITKPLSMKALKAAIASLEHQKNSPETVLASIQAA